MHSTAKSIYRWSSICRQMNKRTEQHGVVPSNLLTYSKYRIIGIGKNVRIAQSRHRSIKREYSTRILFRQLPVSHVNGW